MPGSPLVWIAVVGWIVAGGTYGFQKLKQGQIWQVAYDKGVEAGKGTASTAAIESAAKTADAEREAESDVGSLDDRADIVALCKRSASCKERRTLK